MVPPVLSAPTLKICPPEEQDDADVQLFAKEMKAPLFVARMLRHMGISDKEGARRFFKPDAGLCHPVAQLGQMEAIVDKLLELREAGTPLVVHGDYDVDGLTAAALLESGLRECGMPQVRAFIPSRFTEGYGMSTQVLDEFAEQGIQWVLTVDTGISAVVEVEHARRRGIQVMITDHHRQGNELPEAFAIANPNCDGCDYPN